MKILYFSLAALACVGAIVARLLGAPLAVAVICLALAALGLFAGLRLRAEEDARADAAVVLNEWQREEIGRLLEENRYGTAVKQVQLWHRGVDYAQAEKLVQELLS